jgi:CheY-like chemotaxis protein
MRPMRASKSPTVLVVEDDWLLREDLASELRLEGWTIVEAAAGARAIACLQEIKSLDLLVTDIRLADATTGWEVAEAARELHPETAVVYTSGASDSSGRQVPNSVFLSKPVTAPEVVVTCRRLLLNSSWPADRR